MAHESFEDEATAAVMNELFVPIKVDREERPDIDAIYMGALHALGEQGGWPLTMFLDPDARPVWGGTYFPKETRFGRPAFVDVLGRVAQVFREEPEKVANNARLLTEGLAAPANGTAIATIDDRLLRDLTTRMAPAVDPIHGGIRGAPKFPQWSFFWMLWRGGIRYDVAPAREAVITTLRRICQGGIYDHLGGGFARYSVDEEWLVPHFEKMLYDNALLLDLLTEVWRETREPLFAARVAETVGWIEREMIADGGGFAASLDADSEGEEGKFYVWSLDEILAVLGPEEGRFFADVYDVTPDGNFEGHTILNRLSSLPLRSDADEQRLAAARTKLLEARSKRVRPGWDDKVLADWNGLMIAALARASLIFDKPQWLELARRAFDFVADAHDEGRPPATRLARRHRQGAGDGERLRQHDLGRAAPARGDGRAALLRPGARVDRDARPPLLDRPRGRICNLCRRHARRDRAPAPRQRRRDAQRQCDPARQSGRARHADRGQQILRSRAGHPGRVRRRVRA